MTGLQDPAVPRARSLSEDPRRAERAAYEPRPRIARLLDRVLRPVDRLFNRVYTADWNPLYKSGTLAVLFLAVTLVTGIYLFILYEIGDPYGSVAALDATWHGSFMRSVHRYAADLAVIAILVHIVKILASGRTWGPRALAWVSGIALLGLVLLCGWTGLVMAWDVQGQLVAIEGGRLFDLLPILSEPLSRTFSRPDGVGRSFFFMNLFLHVALPLGLAALFWVHSSRVARASFLPPRAVWRYLLGLVAVVSIVVPVPLPPPADLLAVPVDVPLDLFYAFWLPLARSVSPGQHFLAWVVFIGISVSVPWWWRPRGARIVPSRVDEERCAGCMQCYLDCPYEAISMVPRESPSALSEIVGRVDPELCVSCGICSGSCAPMGVGPGGATGRDQLIDLERFLAARPLTATDVVVVGCRFGAGSDSRWAAAEDVALYSSGCSGSVHTSVIETLLGSGAAGVFMLTCPERDCIYREGPTWLRERLYNDREAELKPRADRRRLRVGSFAGGEVREALAAVSAFRQEVLGLGEAPIPITVPTELECEVIDVAT